MGSRTFRPIARTARPITTERDYRGVKKLVAEHAWTFFFVETERLEALVRELTDYEIRAEESEAGFTVEWAEWAFVQEVDAREEQRRRWRDVLN